MEKIVNGLTTLVCLCGVVSSFNPSPSVIPPDPNPTCYSEQLYKDVNFDLSYVCNDGRPYPSQKIEDALYYAEDHWRMYLNLTSTCFQEKDNFFMNDYTQKDFYHLRSVCKTRRTLVKSVYSQNGMVCHVVHPNLQKVYYATCRGQCNLGYDGVTGYHCIQRGITHRKFLAYCEYVPEYPKTEPLSCFDPVYGEYDPRGLQATPRMKQELHNGQMYQPEGYFTEISVTLPTYCGCRGYFCNSF